MHKKVAVIVVNWNSFSITSDCIQSLQQMNYTDFSIIVTDNGSEDGSVQKFKEYFSEIILIESPTNLGFTGGNNLGIQYAIDHGYEYVFLLNNDTFVKKDLLTILASYMDENTGIGALQPMIYFNHNRNLLWNGGSYFNSWLGNASVPGHNKPVSESGQKIKEVDWITGCAFFIRVSVLKQTGLFTEKMFMYFEDVDLSFRIKQAGYPLFYHPGSCVYHIAGMSNKSKVKNKEGFINPVVHYLNLRNRIWLLKKYTRPIHVPAVILFNLCYILAVMVYFAWRFRFAKLKTVIKAVRDGMTGSINS